MDKGQKRIYCIYKQYIIQSISRASHTSRRRQIRPPCEQEAAMFKAGTWVGAGRWPNQHAHPDHWSKPFRGQVLDFCDVRAWANSIHFPEDVPHAGEVMGVALRLQAA